MRTDGRLSRMLHVLIHMDQHKDAITSERIAKMLSANPVVVRRMMAGLREKGYVQSEKGHGGGWKLSKKLNEINLMDVYEALGEPPIFALGLSGDHSECLVEEAVNASLGEALRDAKALLLSRFSAIKISDIVNDFDILYKSKV